MAESPKIAYRLRRTERLHGFGDEFPEAPILERPLSEHHADAFRASGVEIVDIASDREIRETPCFVFGSDLYFTAEFIKAALDTARGAQGPVEIALPDNRFNRRFSLPHAREETSSFGFAILTQPAHVGASREKRLVRQRVYPYEIALPAQMVRGGVYHYDMSRVFLTRLASPFHLLQANLAANLMRTFPLRRWTPAWMEKHLFPRESRGFLWGLRSLNRYGKNCRIHPTAVIEGCELGDNVSVGAYAVLRLSKIGAGAVIEEHCSVKYSVLGERTYVSQGNQLNCSQTYPGAYLIHGPYQFSIFGRDTAVMAVINCDYRLDQKNISISTDAGILDSGQPLLGVAYGHGAKVGGGNIIAPGRIVPNGFRLTPPDFIRMEFRETPVG